MQILSNTLAVKKNLRVPFVAVGGVEPYNYEVLPGNAGGTISSSGMYTAPDKFGFDVIRVTDSSPTPQVIEETIRILHPLELLCDVIQKELDLGVDQVVVQDNKFNIPEDSRLYVSIGVLTDKPFSNINKAEPRGGNLVEVQSTNWYSVLTIRILSRSDEALYRKEEVLMAVQSSYAKNQMSTNSFSIAKLSNNFIKLNQEEGNAILWEYEISLAIQYSVDKIKPIKYFDSFEHELIY